MDRHYFLLRRLHSLTGIVPIGVFLINHLLTNSSVLWGSFAIKENVEGGWREGGVAYFWKEVKWINEQIPHLLLIEMALWGAIAFHSILGVYYALQGKSNTGRYAYQSNWRYTLQRVSGYIGIFFILYHVGTLRWGWTFLVPGGTQWSHHYASSTLAAALRGGMEGITVAGFLVSLFYLVSVSLLVFHFANGLWTAAITWGLTVTQQAQKRWGYACLGLGAAMMLMGWGSVIGYASLNPAEVQRLEKSLAGEAHSAAIVDHSHAPVVDPNR
jgi:succinate dehydrogenase / fumarate reductase cytochrome b subunit